MSDLVGKDLHAKRVLSLANGVVGVLHAATLAIHTIGEASAAARDLNPKHAVKQIDRLLSHRGLDVEVLAPSWIEFALGDRSEAVVAMDWTDFDGDDQTTLALNLVTTHGRPLCQGSCRPAPLQKGTAEMDLVGQKDRARWPRTQNSSSLGCFNG